MSFHPLRMAAPFLVWPLCGFGLLALIVTAMVAAPLDAAPPLESITKTARTFDRTGIPDLSRFQARDGTHLAYRHYAAAIPDSGRVAILVHGSSAQSTEMHMLAKVLAARGIGTYALDIRGHGASGTRGDIAYTGQLEDDLEDFVHALPQAEAKAALILIGHSSGGGFALRIAGSRLQTLFTKTILLAPYLGFRASTSRPNSGGWAKADLPRAIALSFLQRAGLDWFSALPTLAFAVPHNSVKILTPIYSFRLMTNYAVHFNFRDDLAAATRPVAVIAGADDELMFADRYAAAFDDGKKTIAVHLISGVNHMAVVSDPTATAETAAEALAN